MIQAALAALASIPGVSSAIAKPTPSTSPTTLALLREVRYLLLPGLYGRHPDVELSIVVDAEAECLIVQGYNASNNRLLGFAITKQAIIDNRYKAPFNPGIVRLVLLLTNTAAADYDRMFKSEAFAPRNWNRCHGLS